MKHPPPIRTFQGQFIYLSLLSARSKVIEVTAKFGPLKIEDKPPNYKIKPKPSLITQEYLEEWKFATLPRSPKFKAKPEYNRNRSQNSLS